MDWLGYQDKSRTSRYLPSICIDLIKFIGELQLIMSRQSFIQSVMGVLVK
jgi:hypothetical protein